MSSKRTAKNWEDELLPEDTVINKDTSKPSVLLNALRRLANEAGLCNSGPVTLQHVNTGNFGVFQCIYQVDFEDGTTWSAAGDCNKNSVDPRFLAYPTAVAESRAEARALKKALGITMLAAEEVDMNSGVEVQPNEKVPSNVIAAIERLIDRTGADTLQVIEAVLPNKADSISALSDLSITEGQAIMSHLNGLSAKKTKASSRESKKAAAKAALEEGKQ